MPASILVVDDESSVTDALDLLLRDHGYEVNTASTAWFACDFDNPVLSATAAARSPLFILSSPLVETVVI